MKSNRIIWGLVSLVVLTTFAISLGTMRGHSQQDNSKKQDNKRQEDLKKYPIADYDAPESENAIEQNKRKLKNKRYDKRTGLVSDELPVAEDEEVLFTTHFDSTAGLPVNESELVVIGEVLDAKAYVSTNKKVVYSEFAIRVNEVLKNNSSNIAQNSLISVDREGGAVRYKNGKKRLSIIGGYAMPRIGGRYVLFLKNLEKSPNYEIITGYELKLDGIANRHGDEQFRIYREMSETAFIKEVRKAIAQSLHTVPDKEKQYNEK